MRIYDDYDELGTLISYSDIQSIEAWLRQGKNIDVSDEDGTTGLFHALSMGLFDIVRFLVSHGADINRQRDDGYTPLIQSVISGGLCTKWLVENGADVALKDVEGRTALDHALLWGRQSCIAYLQSLAE